MTTITELENFPYTNYSDFVSAVRTKQIFPAVDRFALQRWDLENQSNGIRLVSTTPSIMLVGAFLASIPLGIFVNWLLGVAAAGAAVFGMVLVGSNRNTQLADIFIETILCEDEHLMCEAWQKRHFFLATPDGEYYHPPAHLS